MTDVTPISREELQGLKAAADKAALDKKVGEYVKEIYDQVLWRARTSEERVYRFQILDVCSKIPYARERFATECWKDDPYAPSSFVVADGKLQTKPISKEIAERFRTELVAVFPGCGVSFEEMVFHSQYGVIARNEYQTGAGFTPVYVFTVDWS
jgi:hypothetical protein